MKSNNKKAILAALALMIMAFAIFYLFLFFTYKDTPSGQLPAWVDWLLN